MSRYISNLSGCLLASQVLFLHAVVSLAAALAFSSAGTAVMMEWECVQLNSMVISVVFTFKWVELLFSGVVSFIGACVLLFSRGYMAGDSSLSRFTWLVMTFILTMNLFIFAGNLISVLVGWDGLGLVSFILVVYYQNSKSIAAGLLTALTNRVGDVALLVAVGLCSNWGHWSLLSIRHTDSAELLCGCILVAGLTKSAQLPFSAWLPAAMAAPTPVSALVHSSTLVTAGVFLLIKFYPFLCGFKWFGPAVLMVGSVTAVVAGVGAYVEFDIKKIIALSTLSQLGLMMVGVGVGAVSCALFHMCTHALFKALLFLCAGAIIHAQADWQDIRKMGCLWGQIPITVACMNVANLALCGVPFMAGFYSKDLIIETMLGRGGCSVGALLIMLVATMLTVAYSVRLSVYSLWGNMKQASLHGVGEDRVLYGPMLILSVGAISGGAALNCLFFSLMTPVFLPFSQKLVVPVVMGLGGALGFISLPLNYKLLSFFSSMWFVVPLSTRFIGAGPMKLGLLYSKILDSGWFEILGGGGVYELGKFLTEYNFRVQSANFNVMLGAMFFVMFSVPLVIWLGWLG